MENGSFFSKFSIESHSVASRILNTGTIHLFYHIVVLVVKKYYTCSESSSLASKLTIKIVILLCQLT